MVTLLGGGALGRQLGHEVGAFINRAGALIEETPVNSVVPSAR